MTLFQDLAEGALDFVMKVYKELFPVMGGYLTEKNKIHLPRLELFMQELSRREPLYFQQRSVEEDEREYATPAYKDHYYMV
jgi:5'-3' exoribonuclease 1